MENKGTPVLEESVRARSVAFVTLGCKLNFSETSTIAQHFVEAGYERVPQNRPADIYVINTCSVTEHADKKCRNFIRKLHKQNPDAIIAVTGCYAQLKPQEILDIEGVDMVVGADRKGDLFQLVNENLKPLVTDDSARFSYSCAISEVNSIFPAFSQGERTRSFLKVQDGCDYHCSYCTIPLARGKSRNLSIATIVGEAKKIAAKGMVEVVLTGVNTGDFGKSTGEKFIDLLKALNEVEGIERYRISSIEPNLLNEETIRWIAGGTKFQNHFHIPLQSGCDRILAKMRRRYNTTMFYDKISMIREIMGDVFFGIDVIVGFPGETDEDFEATYNFLKDKVKPAFIHVFPYSRRADTDAAIMPDQVQESIKSRRVEALTELSDRLHKEYCSRYEGTTQQVLFESTQKGGMMYGYTGNYIKVERKYDKSLIGKITEVTL
ncbi:MAG: tRNA (N(6)-L-threonylcarbamoyladenosine(37)-C(2))-methylthiotransferase MtaB [Bacteroidales bacterium]|nr:tRNA (N(6)-L-threonylcarbamoyladenosine(37)-C(2))-methylthiotransferase MtaB [Bacteroidales bacterium]